MSSPSQPFDYSQLSPAEAILLAEQLWEHARSHAETIPVLPEQLEELKRRLDAMEAGTMGPGESWEEVDAWLETKA